MNIRNLFRTILITSLAALPAGACKRDQPNNFLPNVAFEVFLVLSEPSNFPLQAPGGWIYSTGGVRGLLVYRTTIGTGANDFTALDRACPTHFDQACGRVEMEPDDLYARCPCDGELFLAIDGTPTTGNRALLPYNRTFDGVILRIWN